jgi:hypothetical protein
LDFPVPCLLTFSITPCGSCHCPGICVRQSVGQKNSVERAKNAANYRCTSSPWPQKAPGPRVFSPVPMLPLALFTFLATTNAYIWPSPQLDELDQMRFEQPLAAFVRPCKLFIFDGSNSGRSDTADWIRTVRRKRAWSGTPAPSSRSAGIPRHGDTQCRRRDGGHGRLDPLLRRDGATGGVFPQRDSPESALTRHVPAGRWGRFSEHY